MRLDRARSICSRYADFLLYDVDIESTAVLNHIALAARDFAYPDDNPLHWIQANVPKLAENHNDEPVLERGRDKKRKSRVGSPNCDPVFVLVVDGIISPVADGT